MKHRLGNIALLLGTLLVIFIIDRVLLTQYPLPRWKSDPVLHYTHRSGTFTWGKQYDNKPIHINRYGFHDDDFHERKGEGELRGLIVGDSIVMGHGVTAAETFPNQLERLLPGWAPGYKTYQIINAGVQGYSTFQYLETLKRSLKFSPDFIVIGFCMNDPTEPYLVNTSYGGSGLDYHGIWQISQPWIAYLVNETGFGRFAISIRKRIHKTFTSAEKEARKEIYNVRKMAEFSRSDPVYIEAWKLILRDLSEMYDLARKEKIPIVLIIFPFTFQLGDDKLQEPQRILKEHANQHGVPYLDMTEVAEKLIADGVPLGDLFLDRDHYTVKGHSVLADLLVRHLRANGVI
ncbi:MAG: GDSL-type esterase/lipase family protein [Nitrospirales bacterium]|nr:GDSL-type esterase/lipase family protein [Nitrospirales bacterium]